GDLASVSRIVREPRGLAKREEVLMLVELPCELDVAKAMRAAVRDVGREGLGPITPACRVARPRNTRFVVRGVTQKVKLVRDQSLRLLELASYGFGKRISIGLRERGARRAIDRVTKVGCESYDACSKGRQPEFVSHARGRRAHSPADAPGEIPHLHRTRASRQVRRQVHCAPPGTRGARARG